MLINTDRHIKVLLANYTLYIKIKFSIKDFSSKCDQIRRKLRIWSYLLKKYLMENSIFCAVQAVIFVLKLPPKNHIRIKKKRSLVYVFWIAL